MFFFLFLFGCENMQFNQIINNEKKFNYKGHVNLYSVIGKNIIKTFYSFSYHENLARKNVKLMCIEFINRNNLEDVVCKYMSTKPTQKILTSLN